MREVERVQVARRILADPVTFNDAILGKPMEEYAAWIQKDESWGGAIELTILAAATGVRRVGMTRSSK